MHIVQRLRLVLRRVLTNRPLSLVHDVRVQLLHHGGSSGGV